MATSSRSLREALATRALKRASSFCGEKRTEAPRPQAPPPCGREWLLSVTEGESKWAYSYYRRNADGSLTNKERYFWLHVADWDDAGAEAICYARAKGSPGRR